MSSKSQIHCIPEGELDPKRIDDLIEEQFELEELNEIVLKHFNPEELKIGDVIHFDDYSDYRNDGKVMWGSDQSVIHLGDYDEYGSVPDSLPINLFASVDHFMESVHI